ncbi:MAG: thioredoxin family protein [Pseudomonadota bacterium]|jgi:thiol:disulfide interchange protein
MPVNRRAFVTASLGLLLAAGASSAPHAAPAAFQPYTAEAFARATKAGGPVFVHVYAPWCLQCRAQEGILSRVMTEPRFAGATFLRVSYDGQKEVVDALKVPRSTLIAFKGTRETGRMSWGVTDDAVLKVLDSAY